MMKGESHRVYWQQWIGSNNNGAIVPSDVSTERNRRELITSSAAIRISEAARARDVTRLLHETLFPSPTTATAATTNSASATTTSSDLTNISIDSLVLVGSLYSLPLDYIQFGHETAYNGVISSSYYFSSNETTTAATTTTTAGKRFSILHVFKTLSPDDNPLQVWGNMLKHLHHRQQAIEKHRSIRSSAPSTNVISPKLQWFFVPGYVPLPSSDKVSTIPSYIDLEGYCTSMEEEDEGDDGDDHASEEKENNWIATDFDDIYWGNGYNEQPLAVSFPWECLVSHDNANVAEADEVVVDEDHSENSNNKHRQQQEKTLRKQHRQQHLAFQIYQYQEQHPHCKAGYLLLQSQRDTQVWRQVYCVLAADCLWYATRIYHHDDVNETQRNETENTDNPNNGKRSGASWAHHGRIPLSRALLLEHPVTASNSADNNSGGPRIPLGLEIVQANGISHVFRASNRSVQRDWIQTLSRAMSSCHENSLLEHAQVIVEDETRARYQRLGQVAIHPLWEKLSSSSTSFTIDNIVTGEPTLFATPIVPNNGHVMNVLRLGMQVASYREQCRHAKQQQQQFKQQQQQQQQEQSLQQQLLSSPTTIKKQLSSSNSTPHLRQAQQQTPPPPQQTNKSQLPPTPLADTAAERTMSDKIRATWDAATILLARATQVAMELQTTMTSHRAKSSSPSAAAAVTSETTTTLSTRDGAMHSPLPSKPTMARSLDTLCRHIEYIITGRLRPFSSVSSSSSSSVAAGGDNNMNNVMSPPPPQLTRSNTGTPKANHQDPAPVDLFDPLLAELQLLAVTADNKALQLHRTTSMPT